MQVSHVPVGIFIVNNNPQTMNRADHTCRLVLRAIHRSSSRPTPRSGGELGAGTHDHWRRSWVPLSRGRQDVNALDRPRRRLASFRQNVPPSPALMLRSRAFGPRAQIVNAVRRGVSKHEGTQVGCSRLEHSILPISGKPEIGRRLILRDGGHSASKTRVNAL
jgi:hypothetical protein